MEIRRSKNAFIVGIFVVVALGIFIVAVFTLGGQHSTFARKFPLKVVFKDINGLKEGNNIWFSGVKVGVVKRIELKGFSDVEVTLNVEWKNRTFIHQDATAMISSDGLLGNKIVVIYGGSASLPQIEENAYLAVQQVDPSEDMMSLLKTSNKNLAEITANFKTISRKISDGEGTIGKLINDPSLANTLQGTLFNFKRVSDNFKLMSQNSRNVVANLESFTGRMNEEGSSINKLLKDSTLYDSIRSSILQVKKVTVIANDFANNINAFANNLKLASNGLKDSTNPAGLLLNDKETANSLEATIRNLEAASKKLDEDLEAVQHNFLFRGYFRKKNKNNPPKN